MVVRVLALAGMPGSGKGIIAGVAAGLGLPVFSCGDVVREYAFEKGLAPKAEILGRLMFELREVEGPSAVAKRLISRMGEISFKAAMVEGIRSMAEVEELKKVFNVSIMAIHSSPKTRFLRLRVRSRSDDPQSPGEFYLRDRRELKVGIGEVISSADLMLINEEDLDRVKERAEALLRRWLEVES